MPMFPAGSNAGLAVLFLKSRSRSGLGFLEEIAYLIHRLRRQYVLHQARILVGNAAGHTEMHEELAYLVMAI